jgi:hypothetical protein
MNIIRRTTLALFSALPAGLFFILVTMSSESMSREYYWISILAGVIVLLGGALLFGFAAPPGFGPRWVWIIVAGFGAMLCALFAIAFLNATPLCVGQDNGDGNNSFGMCMGYVILYAFFYGVPYMLLLTVSAFVGHWVIKLENRFGGRL